MSRMCHGTICAALPLLWFRCAAAVCVGGVDVFLPGPDALVFGQTAAFTGVAADLGSNMRDGRDNKQHSSTSHDATLTHTYSTWAHAVWLM